MQQLPTRRGTSCLAMVALVLQACAATPDNDLATGQEGAPGVHKFLVCAPNTAIALQAELQDSTRPLRVAIEAYLRSQGREVEWVDLYEGRTLWKSALADAKDQGDITRTPRIFAAELAQRFDFQAIVMPSILVHQERANRGGASWYGVQRRMRMVNAPKGPGGRSRSALADGVAFSGISGDTLVTSVRLVVFSREGERIFEGRGGLDFVHEIDLSPLEDKLRYRLAVRNDLFSDPEVLREGIGIAFSPYLPPTDP